MYFNVTSKSLSSRRMTLILIRSSGVKNRSFRLIRSFKEYSLSLQKIWKDMLRDMNDGLMLDWITFLQKSFKVVLTVDLSVKVSTLKMDVGVRSTGMMISEFTDVLQPINMDYKCFKLVF
jgi:hypothetical protein